MNMFKIVLCTEASQLCVNEREKKKEREISYKYNCKKVSDL